MMSGFSVGIDLGGTKIMTILLNDEHRVVAQHRVDTLASQGPDPVIGRMADSVRAVLQKSGLTMKDVDFVGVCSPGPLNVRTGIVLCPPNLPGWIDIPLQDRLAKELDVKVFLDNDANAAALAEWKLGAGRGTQDLLYLTISTGIGGGAIVGGRLQYGKMGAAAEFGHIIVNPQGPRCNCGNAGCLEALASGTAIAKAYTDAVHTHGASSQSKGVPGGESQEYTARDVFKAYQSGDPIATEVFRAMVDSLAIGLTNLVHIYNPERIVIGGGVAETGELLLGPVRERMNHYVFPHLQGSFDVVKAELGGHVGAVGAAILGR